MKPRIYQRKSDNRWVGDIELKSTVPGKRKRKVVYGKTEKEVWEKLNPILFALQTGEFIEPSKDTLIDFLKDYHRVCSGCDMWAAKTEPASSAKWERTTSELYKMYIDTHFDPYFGRMKLKDVRSIVLDEFYNRKLTERRKYVVTLKGVDVTKYRDPMSINSVIKLNKFLKSAFNYAVINDMIKKNPTDGVKLSSQVKYKPAVYDEDQFLQLLTHVSGKDEEIPIILGAGCGLRRGEICGLKWGDVDFYSQVITINKAKVSFSEVVEKGTKNESSNRRFIAPGYVIEIMQRHYEKLGCPGLDVYVVTKWKPKSLSQRFNELLENYKLDHIRFHDLRHYNAVVMLKNGITDKIAAERLGHSNVQTLRSVYQHVLDEMDDDAAAKINRSIMPKKELSKEEKKKAFKVV